MQSIIIHKFNFFQELIQPLIDMEAKTEDLRYHHFSHDHLLDYTKLQPHVHTTCSACRKTISPENFYYKCKLCGFYLHQVCFNMPENVTHPSDPNHNLTLETFPTPSKLPIKCKACQNSIKGFYYRCSKCTHYYHTLCLAAPLSMKTTLHRHSLNIEFVPVYDFQCDLCDKPSYSGWVYHCNLCEFDSHLSCVLNNNNNNNKGSMMPLDVVESHPPTNNILPQDDQPSMVSNDQDHGIQSFQLSETCFSIDFQKSLIGNDDDKMMQSGVHREVAIPEEVRMFSDHDGDGDNNQHEGFEESSKRSEKSRSSNYGGKSVSSGGIGAHIWTELEQATEKRNSKGGDTKVESDSGRWSSMGLPNFMCCFIHGQSKGIRGKTSS